MPPCGRSSDNLVAAHRNIVTTSRLSMHVAGLAHFVLQFCARDEFDTHDGQFVPGTKMSLTLLALIHSVLVRSNTKLWQRQASALGRSREIGGLATWATNTGRWKHVDRDGIGAPAHGTRGGA